MKPLPRGAGGGDWLGEEGKSGKEVLSCIQSRSGEVYQAGKVESIATFFMEKCFEYYNYHASCRRAEKIKLNKQMQSKCGYDAAATCKEGLGRHSTFVELSYTPLL